MSGRIAELEAELERLEATILAYEEQEADFTPDDWDGLDKAIRRRTVVRRLLELASAT